MESEDIETLKFLYGENQLNVLREVEEHSEEFSKHLKLKNEFIPFLFAYIINECNDDNAIEIVKEFFGEKKQPEDVASELGLSLTQVNKIVYKCWELFDSKPSPRDLSGRINYVKLSLNQEKVKARIREYINAKIKKIQDLEKKEGRTIYRCSLPNCDYSVSFEDIFDIGFRCKKHGCLLKEEREIVPEFYRKLESWLQSLIQYL